MTAVPTIRSERVLPLPPGTCPASYRLGLSDAREILLGALRDQLDGISRELFALRETHGAPSQNLVAEARAHQLSLELDVLRRLLAELGGRPCPR